MGVVIKSPPIGVADPAAISSALNAQVPAIVRSTNKSTGYEKQLTFNVTDAGDWFMDDGGSTANDAAWATLRSTIEAETLAMGRRALIQIRAQRPGSTNGYRFNAPIRVPKYADLDGRTARLWYMGTGYSQPFLTLGLSESPAGSPFGGVYQLPMVFCNTLSTHRCSALTATMDLDAFAGVRIETTRADIQIPHVEGFAIGVQFRPVPGGSIAYNTVRIGSLIDNRIHIDWYGTENTGWVNENEILRAADIRCSSSFADMGNSFAMRYGATAAPPGWATGVAVSSGERRSYQTKIYTADGAGTTGATAPTHSTGSVSDGAVSWTYVGTVGYTGESGNGLLSGCIQLSTPRAWAASRANIKAGHQHMNGGLLYEAQADGTSGATAPTHTSGVVSDGALNWKCLGLARRSILWMAGAGGRSRIRVSRWEGGYGMPILVTGIAQTPRVSLMHFGDGISMQIDGVSAITMPPNTPLGVDTGIEFQPDNPTTVVAIGACESRVTRHDHPPDLVDQLEPAHLSLLATGGGTVWTANHGWAFMAQSTANSYPARESTVTADGFALCDDGVNVVVGTTRLGHATLFGPDCAAFRSEMSVGFDTTDPPRWACRALGSLVDGASGGNPALRTLTFSGRPHLVSGGLSNEDYLASSEFLSAAGDGLSGHIIWRNSKPCIGAFVMVAGGKVVSLSVAMRITNTTQNTGAKGVPIYRFYGRGRRACSGLPDRGRFPARGEIIEDTTGSTNGWRVTTAGDLAKAWTSGETAIPRGALRSNGSNVYLCNAATATATAGATAPTGTSLTADVSDGTTAWRYVGPVAALTAA